jgi:hypothetical protein
MAVKVVFTQISKHTESPYIGDARNYAWLKDVKESDYDVNKL